MCGKGSLQKSSVSFRFQFLVYSLKIIIIAEMKTIQYIINRFGLRAGFRVKSYLDICFVLHTIVFDSLATVQLAL